MEEMCLEEAIEIIENDLDMYINDLMDIYRQSKVKPFEKAIKRVLSELDKRIPIEKIEHDVKKVGD